MKVVQTRVFERAAARLHPNQVTVLDEAIAAVMANPSIGQQKRGDLAGVRVYKFPMVKQLTLLAYTYVAKGDTLTLLALGSHENFYRDLKKRK